MGDTNAQNNDIAAIRDVLGLSKSSDKYEIVRENSFYVIQPVSRNGLLHIAPIMSAEIFSQYNLEFRNCAFDNLHFTNETIKKKIRFQRCTFKKCILDRCVFKKFVNFNFGNLKGSCKGNFVCTDTIFEDIAYFIKLTFERKADFSRSRFKERAFFSETTFNNSADFTEVIFDNNAYFDDVDFQGEAIFRQSEFYKNAHFCQTIFQHNRYDFKKEPDFRQVILNGNIILTSTKIFDINFEQLESEIQTNSNANEFRNIFKNIKNALIRDNNLLDASHFHKMELYAKELELKYKKEEAEEESGIRDTVDKIQLMLYRVTSDHHTDLMLILTNVLALIVLFAIASIILLCCTDYLPKWIGTNNECHVLEQSRYLFAMLPKHLHEYIKLIVWGEITIIITLCATFVYVFKCIVCHIYAANNNKKLHCCFIVVFLVNAFILAIKPAIMLPIFGKLIDESLKIDFPAFTSLSVVYAILMFLLIWSLQKTARKNTIVPN
ncbi:MAG: pentapeptide repeat-containing protein [Helicobacter sp.]|nr:pentapeptide repeat-containing protein [Helicobacter sp.]